MDEAALLSAVPHETINKRPVLLCNHFFILAIFNSENVARFQSLCASCWNNFWYYDCAFRCLSFCCRTCSYSRLTFDLFAFTKLTQVCLLVPVPIQPHLFVKNEIAKAKKDIEIVEVNRKRDSEISKKNDEILDFKARTAIAEYKAMIANQFLVYGYAEEYTRLQKMMGVYKGDELSTEIDKMGLKKKAGVYVDGKSSKPID